MSFRPLGGIDQRSGQLKMDDTSSPELLNVALHPVGHAKNRAGFELFSDVEEADEEIMRLAYLEQAAIKYLFAFTTDKIYRTEIQGGAISWSLQHTYTGDQTKFNSVSAPFIEDSNTATPDKRGPCLYISCEDEMPRIDLGDVSPTDHVVFPSGVYGDDSQYSGVHGAPTSSTGGPEWRDWLTDPPQGLLLSGVGKEDQLLAWGFPGDPNRIDHSEVGVPWNMLKSDIDGVNPGDSAADGGWWYAMDDSDHVMGVWRLYDLTVVFKRNKLLIYTGSPGYDMALRSVHPVGCVSYRSVVQVGTDLMWWSDQGPVSLRGIQEYGDVGYDRIGLLVADEITAMVPALENSIHCYHDKDNYRAVWFLSDLLSAGVNRALAYYYDRPGRWSVWDGGYTEHSCSLYAPGHDTDGYVVWAGDYAGNVNILNRGITDNGTDIVSAYVTKWLDLDSENRKRPIYIDMMYGSVGAEDLVISLGWDYAPTWFETTKLSRMLGHPPQYWGSAIWGTAVWGGTSEVTKRYSLTGNGFVFRLKFSSTGSKPFEIVGWRPEFSPKGQR